jgi:predicted TIM-barrel fold metal-dependent hydrolase
MGMLPKIISVDDHVIEAPDLWTTRVSAKYRDRAPRLVRGQGLKGVFRDGEYVFEERDDLGPCDYWLLGDVRMPVTNSFSAVGFPRDEVDMIGITYDDMPPATYDPAARLEAMDQDGVEASLCFPNLIPRFAGQTFLEEKDKDLALECVYAYNDWIIEEWCGASGGRLAPICLIPLWDPRLAGDEVRRNAARGAHAVTFTELPWRLGLPSIHDRQRHWDPFFSSCAETGTVICMHIGSSGLPSSSIDAPFAVVASNNFGFAMLSMADWLFSGLFERFPTLKIVYSEAQIGWIPALLERADRKWELNPAYYDANAVRRKPSSYYYEHVYGCFIDDPFGARNIDATGEDNVMLETDFPHSDTTWPTSQANAEKELASLTDAQKEKAMRLNAIRVFNLPFGGES